MNEGNAFVKKPQPRGHSKFLFAEFAPPHERPRMRAASTRIGDFAGGASSPVPVDRGTRQEREGVATEAYPLVDQDERTASDEAPTQAMEYPPSHALASESLKEREKNVDGLQTQLCAELLSSLSQCRLPQKTGDSVTTEARAAALALSRQLYEDEDVVDFARRIDRLAAKTGIIPPLVLSCVMNESLRSNVDQRRSVAVDPVSEEKEKQLSRVLFDLVWRRHHLSCSACRTDDIDDSMQPFSGESHTEDIAMDEKRRIRQEKLLRWKEKRKSRDFTGKIRYPARQHLANARKRRKGQFVSNKDATDIAP